MKMALENIANENTYTVDVKGVNDFMELTYSLELNSHVINNEKMKNRYERKIIKAAQEHIADSLLSYNRIMGLVDEAINGNRNWDSIRHAVFMAFENSNRAKVNTYTHNQYVEVINRYGDKPYIKNSTYIFVV